ncbi:MAG: HlyD family efflux transporter periplasmic adaptor subunit, partial [Lachnospiraceae bacterium]|nr:HlyD family efflux transporter periplasmic adaptor subunit [Lachnospiraceae bacterium]
RRIRRIAIVFFAVLLILTFFSNTIMNLTLPQVAVAKVKSGMIYHKVRGNGKVETVHHYDVKLKRSKKIARISVSEGDTVSENQLLFVCETGEDEELAARQEALGSLQLEYQKSLLEMGSEYGTKNIEIQNARDELAAAIEKKNQAVSGEGELAALKQSVGQKEEELAGLGQKLEEAQNKLANAGGAKDIASVESEIQAMERELEALNIALGDLQADLQEAEAKENAEQQTSISRQIRDKEKEIAYKKEDLKSKRKEQKKAKKDNQKLESLETAAKEAKDQYDIKSGELEREKEKLSNLESSLMTVEEAEKLVKEKELALKELLLEEKKENLDFAYLEKQVNKQEQEVAGLMQEENEVRSPVSGVISKINLEAGDTAAAEETVITINMTGEGYTVSFPVTTEQSSYVSVGDEAAVLNVWDESTEAELISIKADPDDPDRSRILTFRIQGEEIVQGQSLAISVGEMQNTYDAIVPIGAVYEDNQGSFVYILHVRATPLGNRYLAERRTVDVLAADDKNAAVSADFSSEDYVITESMEPIEDGEKVRLLD